MNQDLPGPQAHSVVSTSLKWGEDGELSRVDRDRLLELLCAVDPVATVMIDQLGTGNA